jgi:CRISPR-associated RAMP protein (TIGR02581 family)
MFNEFKNRVRLDAELITRTPLFIGANSDSFKPTAINGACVKDAYGNPYIPGSSLKGVLRAFCESLCGDKATSDVAKNFKNKEDRAEYKDPKDLATEISKESTDVERLFGTAVMSGKVKIADAVLPEGERVKTDVRNGVTIDRDTHTAAGGALFETETVPAGTKFEFRLSAENLEHKEAETLSKLLQYFAEGNILVGGRSRAGLGEVILSHIKGKVWKAEQGKFPVPIEFDGLDKLMLILEGDGK